MQAYQDDVLRIEHERIGNKLKVTARRGTEALYIDTIDVASATQRQRFVKAVCAKCPTVKAEDLDAELLKLADTTSMPGTPSAMPTELDVSRIVRPEQFNTPDVAGLTVPVVISMGGSRRRGGWSIFGGLTAGANADN